MSASFTRSASAETWLASTWRLGTTRSSASSTMAVPITTPGETPMPFLISIAVRSFFAEFALKELGELVNSRLGVLAGGFDAHLRPLGCGEDDHLHDALAVRGGGLLTQLMD